MTHNRDSQYQCIHRSTPHDDTTRCPRAATYLVLKPTGDTMPATPVACDYPLNPYARARYGRPLRPTYCRWHAYALTGRQPPEFLTHSM